MDFIVSRVVMSVCALLVIGVLAGAVDIDRFDGPDGELTDIALELCDMIDDVAGSSAETELLWAVPSLISGQDVRVQIAPGSIAVHSADNRAFSTPSCRLHIWAWDGSSLNRSQMEALDQSYPSLEVSSGHSLVLESHFVDFEGARVPLVFVRQSG